MTKKSSSPTLSTCMAPVGTTTCNTRWVAALLATSGLLTNSAFATNNDWLGVTTDWNSTANWSLGRVPANPNGQVAPADTFDDALINTITPNIAVISANVPTVRDIMIGGSGGTTGRLDHTAGNAATGGGNWMFVGTSGGNGTYNLANTAASGGILTGFGQGSGNLTVGGRLYVGGRDNGGGGIGTLNVNTSGTMAIGNDLAVGSSGGTAVMNVDAGTITTGGWNFIGKNEGGTGANGTLNMSGGTLTNTGRTYVGQEGSTGKMVLSGGTYKNVNNEPFVVGENTGSHGEVVINNANSLLQSGGELWLGQGTGSDGKLTMSAGAVTVNSWVAIGRDGGTGLLNMSGGSITKTGAGSQFIVGASGPGTMNQSAGLTDVQGGITWVGEANNTTGTLNLSGSAEFRSSAIEIGVNGGVTGNLNLNGGTLRTGQIRGGNGTANVSFNGTQIIATADQTEFIKNLDTANVASGGVKVDTNSFSLTVPQGLTGAGALTKSGAGSLILTGSNSYTGGTSVTGGTLLINGNQSLATGLVTVGSGATLGGKGTSGGDLSIGAGGTLAPGNSAETLTVTGSAVFDPASSLAYELNGADTTVGGGVNDLLTGVVNLTLDGTLNVAETTAGSFLSASMGSQWRLINYTGTLTNNGLGLGSAPALTNGLAFEINTSTAGQVNLVVVPEPAVTGILGAALAAFGLRRRRQS